MEAALSVAVALAPDPVQGAATAIRRTPTKFMAGFDKPVPPTAERAGPVARGRHG